MKALEKFERWSARKAALRKEPGRCCRCAKTNANGKRQCDACASWAADYRARKRTARNGVVVDAKRLADVERRLANVEHYFAQLSTVQRVALQSRICRRTTTTPRRVRVIILPRRNADDVDARAVRRIRAMTNAERLQRQGRAFNHSGHCDGPLITNLSRKMKTPSTSNTNPQSLHSRAHLPSSVVPSDVPTRSLRPGNPSPESSSPGGKKLLPALSKCSRRMRLATVDLPKEVDAWTFEFRGEPFALHYSIEAYASQRLVVSYLPTGRCAWKNRDRIKSPRKCVAAACEFFASLWKNWEAVKANAGEVINP